MLVICLVVQCCYMLLFVVPLLRGGIPSARWSANILGTAQIQGVSNTHCTEELVNKTAKTKHESTGSI